MFELINEMYHYKYFTRIIIIYHSLYGLTESV